MESALNVLLFSSSLRKCSTNTGLIKYVLSLSPSFPSVTFDHHSLHDLPLYNGDLDPTEARNPIVAKAWPETVQVLRNKVEKADLLIIAVSEHNANVSPVLINAISWASRAEKVIRDGKEVTIAPIMGKKVAILSCAGRLGGENAQNKLRGMGYLNWQYIDLEGGPLKLGAFKPGNFDEKGELIDEESKKTVKALVEHAINVVSKK